MKKPFVVLLSLIIAISMFSACNNNNTETVNNEEAVKIEDKEGEAEDTDGTEIGNELSDSLVLSNDLFSITVPGSWAEKLVVITEQDSIHIYQKAAYGTISGGFLCAIETYEDEFYKEIPCYDIITTIGNITYIAQYPSDVQADIENEESMKEYFELYEQMPEIIKNTFVIADGK